MEYFTAKESDINPEELSNAMERYRNCHRYIDGLPSGDIKSDLNYIADLAFDLICDIAYEHGIEGEDGLIQFFDNCDFSQWKSCHDELHKGEEE